MRRATIHILGMLLAIDAVGQTALNDWKEKDQAYKKEVAILAALGKQAAAERRAEAWKLKYPRLEAMAKRKAISEAALRVALRDEALANLAVLQAREERVTATLDKKLDAATKTCAAGDAAACDEGAALYAGLFQSRMAQTTIQVRKAEAELRFEEASYDGMSQLVAAGAVDPAVLPEEKRNLEARQAELKAAEEQRKLAEQAGTAR